MSTDAIEPSVAATAPDRAMPWVTPGLAPLGVVHRVEGSIFRVYAHADAMLLRLVHPGSLRLLEVPMAPDPAEAGVWRAAVEGDLRGWGYSFVLRRGNEVIGDIIDPWARLIRAGRAVVWSDRAAVTPRPPLDPRDAVIYELHVRDFTRDASSGVRHDWRGRYLGLTQRGTLVPGTQLSTGVDHLLELGVNVLQLMPVHSFALPYHPEYEWGYMPMDYNAPHEGYAAGVEVDSPIREFKRMVSSLHGLGLRVTLDVVYNHTYERWPNSTGADTAGAPAPARLRSFMALAPREYFRFGADGRPSDGSACGNEFRSDSPMGRRFLVESVKYWVHEFGIDGFRFDLMGLIDAATMETITRELHAIDPTIMVYGEPWAAGPTPIEVNSKGRQRGRGWGVFNDEYRDALRGSVFRPEEPGFLATGCREPDAASGVLSAGPSDARRCIERIRAGLAGSIASFADSPLESINYIECHDNHTLRDRLALSTRGHANISPADRERMNKLGILMLLVSQGTPFIHSGQELGRSKGGYDNTYNMGDEVNNLPWALKGENHRLFEFYRRAIALRRQHPMFRLGERALVENAVTFPEQGEKSAIPPGVLACLVTDPTGQDEWKEALLLFNGSPGRLTVPLPPGAGRAKWRALVDDGSFTTLPAEKRTFVTRSIELGPHAAALLYRER